MPIKIDKRTNLAPRLFVDLDGTLAEWRNIEFNVTSYEDGEDYMRTDKAARKLREILLLPGYFSSLLPYDKVCKAINNLAKKREVYVLSCAIPKEGEPSPESEKRMWVRKNLPNIPDERVIIVPDGENKSHFIEGGIRSGDVLLDDYTKNLRDFEASGGKGIKLLNDINESKGSWKGNTVSKDALPFVIERDIEMVLGGAHVRHISPKKNRTPYMMLTVENSVDKTLRTTDEETKCEQGKEDEKLER